MQKKFWFSLCLVIFVADFIHASDSYNSSSDSEYTPQKRGRTTSQKLRQKVGHGYKMQEEKKDREEKKERRREQNRVAAQISRNRKTAVIAQLKQSNNIMQAVIGNCSPCSAAYAAAIADENNDASNASSASSSTASSASTRTQRESEPVQQGDYGAPDTYVPRESFESLASNLLHQHAAYAQLATMHQHISGALTQEQNAHQQTRSELLKITAELAQYKNSYASSRSDYPPQLPSSPTLVGACALPDPFDFPPFSNGDVS